MTYFIHSILHLKSFEKGNKGDLFSHPRGIWMYARGMKLFYFFQVLQFVGLIIWNRFVSNRTSGMDNGYLFLLWPRKQHGQSPFWGSVFKAKLIFQSVCITFSKVQLKPLILSLEDGYGCTLEDWDFFIPSKSYGSLNWSYKIGLFWTERQEWIMDFCSFYGACREKHGRCSFWGSVFVAKLVFPFVFTAFSEAGSRG